MQANQHTILKILPRPILGFPKKLFNFWKQKYRICTIIFSDTSSLSEDVGTKLAPVSQPPAMGNPQIYMCPDPDTYWTLLKPAGEASTYHTYETLVT